jgi:hypothetical protein
MYLSTTAPQHQESSRQTRTDPSSIHTLEDQYKNKRHLKHQRNREYKDKQHKYEYKQQQERQQNPERKKKEWGNRKAEREKTSKQA